MKHDLFELFGLLLQRHLEILLPEESRVAQARGKHTLIPRDDRLAAVIGVDVCHAHEMRG